MTIKKVRYDIPPPENHYLKIYPWDTVEVDGSFRSKRPSRTMRFQVRAANKRYAPRKFICRKRGEGSIVWRVE